MNNNSHNRRHQNLTNDVQTCQFSKMLETRLYVFWFQNGFQMVWMFLQKNDFKLVCKMESYLKSFQEGFQMILAFLQRMIWKWFMISKWFWKSFQNDFGRKVFGKRWKANNFKGFGSALWGSVRGLRFFKQLTSNNVEIGEYTMIYQ